MSAGRVNVHLSAPQLAEIDRVAVATGCNRSQVIRACMAAAMGRDLLSDREPLATHLALDDLVANLEGAG